MLSFFRTWVGSIINDLGFGGFIIESRVEWRLGNPCGDCHHCPIVVQMYETKKQILAFTSWRIQPSRPFKLHHCPTQLWTVYCNPVPPFSHGIVEKVKLTFCQVWVLFALNIWSSSPHTNWYQRMKKDGMRKLNHCGSFGNVVIWDQIRHKMVPDSTQGRRSIGFFTKRIHLIFRKTKHSRVGPFVTQVARLSVNEWAFRLGFSFSLSSKK